MKIKINPEMITDAPYSPGGPDIFLFDEGLLDSATKDILFGNPSAILVSGYRGSGKTSFVNKLEEKVHSEWNNLSGDQNNSAAESDAPVRLFPLFIRVDVARQEERGILLRRIIRGLYHALADKHSGKSDLIPRGDQLFEEIELLYERTFFDVNTVSESKLINESTTEFLASLNIKTMVFWISALIISGLNTITGLTEGILKDHGFSPAIGTAADMLLFAAVLISVLFKTLRFSVKQSKKRKDTQQLTKKTLYDDDISEHHLLRILGELKDKKIHVIVVVDELDKIETPQNLVEVVRAFKPVMLSGKATFILVAGLGLYYTYLTSRTSDDALVGSLFSNVVHVPLQNIDHFRGLFKKILVEPDRINLEIVIKFVDSLVLRSNRIPRTFMNLLRQDLQWVENEAFVELYGESDIHETDSRLLSAIESLVARNISVTNNAPVQVDYLRFQLHLMVHHMLYRKDLSFGPDEICPHEASAAHEAPAHFRLPIPGLAENLLIKCEEQTLIENTQSDEQVQGQYRWCSTAAVKPGMPPDLQHNALSDLQRGYQELDRIVREMWISEIEKETHTTTTPEKLSQFIGLLEKHSVVHFRSDVRDCIATAERFLFSNIYNSLKQPTVQEILQIAKQIAVNRRFIVFNAFYNHVTQLMNHFAVKVSSSRLGKYATDFFFDLVWEDSHPSVISFHVGFIPFQKQEWDHFLVQGIRSTDANTMVVVTYMIEQDNKSTHFDYFPMNDALDKYGADAWSRERLVRLVLSQYRTDPSLHSWDEQLTEVWKTFAKLADKPGLAKELLAY